MSSHGDEPAASAKKRILVVDDDPDLRSLYTEFLTAEGFEVVSARDGLEAFELFLDAGPFDALLVDQDMPRLGGKQLLGQLRALGQSAPALLVSGRLRLDPDEPLALGLQAWLHKPLSSEALITAIRKLVSARAET